MLGTVFNIFRIPDLRNKVIFTVAMLIIYRIGFHIQIPCFDQIGFHIQIPCFDQSKIEAAVATRDTDSPLGRAAEYMQIFTGGTLSRSSLFGLGIMPYITSSIILMLLGEVIPALKKLRQEGQTGHKKIQEYTRYLTVLICVIQSMMYMKMLGGYTWLYLCRYAHSGCDNGRCWYDGWHRLLDVARRTDRRIRHRQRY
jgi:preprotein translocase subunit SecY